ncbi:chromosome segregation protein SMC [Fusibacter sp. JL216-2]|uniref:chromosome segregation protein SMC n=1 Tax=Fusibacter sp. JL216-2 TaxID=3071453 RepID=UPI003D33B875
MYLKKLEMKGFKSFADKTEVEYENGVTCIVGPNGSGKSNITDAVRWVLGEQKVKTLRGAKMEDVIFNGTKHRKPLGMAEVSLVFDNREKFFPLDYSEVTVTRRVFRSGDSEYLVNGTSCRLKDVKELFMDTGIGTDGYSIIGQGRIDRILSNNADERRQIFEEAAGIVKYKSRKVETEKKLKNTHANLLRVDDIITELEGRVEPLRKESEKAQQYLEHSEKLKSLEMNLYIRQVDSCDEKMKAEKQKTEDLQKKLTSMQNELADVESEIERIEDQMDQYNKSVKTAEEAFLNATSQMGHYEAKVSQIKEKQNAVNANATRIEGELESLEAGLLIQSDGLIEAQNVLKALDETLGDLNDQLLVIQKEYDEKAKALTDKETDSESAKQRAIQILNAIEREKIEIASRQSSIENLAGRIDAIQLSMHEADSHKSGTNEKRNALEESLEALKSDYASTLRRREDQNELLKKVIEEGKQLESEINSLNHKNMKASSERRILIDMEKAFEGYDHSVKGVLKACSKDEKLGHGVHGVVTSLMKIPKSLERAVEVALGRQLQNVVTESEKDAKRLIDHLKRNSLGRVTFLPLSNIRPNRFNVPAQVEKLDGFIGVADTLLGYEDKYKSLFAYLLGRTVIVEDYETAVACLKISGMRHRIVTKDGEILTPGGAITGGSFKSKIANLLGRKRKIDELGALIESYKKDLQVKMDDKEKKLKALDEYQNEIKSLTESCETQRIDIARMENEIRSLVQDLERLNKESDRLGREYDVIHKEKENAQRLIEEKSQKIIELEKENKNIENDMQSYSDGINVLQQEVRRLSETMTTQKVELASVQQKRSHQELEMKRLEGAVKQGQADKLRKDNELTSIIEERDRLDEELSIAVEDMRSLRKSMLQIEMDKEELSVKLQGCQTTLANKRMTHEKDIAELDDLKDVLHKQDLILAKIEMEKENIIKNLWEKYEVGLREALEYRIEIDVDEAETEVKSLRGKIRRLGEVNISSIEEYKEVKERYEFLTSERDDLLKSQKSLEKVIKDLEKKMIEQFTENFKIVKEHFTGIFSKLFEGGQADLVLLDKEDILNSGIEIVAQPPGKKLQSLSLLSGGERAMTAIALLFAILKTKPAPFCILDEIEAALDDVNVFRFADFLKEFTRNSQFVIITHRKGTMEIANTLYGVTMQEYGVSKIVSVRLEDVAI